MSHGDSESKPIEFMSSIGNGYIVCSPGTCNGEPRIAGTQIIVRHVYIWIEQHGMSVSQVVENYPQLSPSAVHTALAYSWSNPDQIHRAIDAKDRLVTDLKAKNAP